MKQMAIVFSFDEEKISCGDAADLLERCLGEIENVIAEDGNGIGGSGVLADIEDGIFVDDEYDDWWDDEDFG